MAEKKRKGRRAYLDDFQKTASGEYIYTGATHAYATEGMSRSKALAVLWALTAVMAGAVLASGLVPVAGMSAAYVVVPYVGSLASALSLLWLLCRLSAGGDPLRDYVYTATVKRSALRSALTIAFAACSLLGDGIYLILHGFGSKVAGTAVFLVCQTLLCVCGIIWKKFFNGLKWAE
jgi:hypothetical protein